MKEKEFYDHEYLLRQKKLSNVSCVDNGADSLSF